MQDRVEKHSLEPSIEERESKKQKIAETPSEQPTKILDKNQLIDLTCSISAKLYSNPVDTDCNHTFEEELLLQWIDTQKKSNPTASPTCPHCRTPFHNLTPNPKKKKEVENYLLENPSKMGDRYCEKKQIKELAGAIKSDDAEKILVILQANLHFFFSIKFCTKSFCNRLAEPKTSFTTYKKCIDLLYTYPKFFDLIKKGEADNAKWNLLHSTCYIGDLQKVKYLLEDLKLRSTDFLRARSNKGENILHLCAISKNAALFSYLLDVAKEDAKAMILENQITFYNTYLNVFPIICASNSPEMLQAVLTLFKDETDTKLIAGKLFFMADNDIFSCLAGNSDHAMTMTKMVNDFLETKFSKEEIKILKSIGKKNAISGGYSKMFQFFAKQQKQNLETSTQLKTISQNINHIHDQMHNSSHTLGIVEVRLSNNRIVSAEEDSPETPAILI